MNISSYSVFCSIRKGERVNCTMPTGICASMSSNSILSLCKSVTSFFAKTFKCAWNEISFTFLYDYTIRVKQEHSLFSIRNHISLHKRVPGFPLSIPLLTAIKRTLLRLDVSVAFPAWRWSRPRRTPGTIPERPIFIARTAPRQKVLGWACRHGFRLARFLIVRPQIREKCAWMRTSAAP